MWAPAVCRLLELKWLHEGEIEEKRNGTSMVPGAYLRRE